MDIYYRFTRSDTKFKYKRAAIMDNMENMLIYKSNIAYRILKDTDQDDQ